MKKLIPLLIIAIVVGGLWLFASERRGPGTTVATAAATGTPATSAQDVSLALKPVGAAPMNDGNGVPVLQPKGAEGSEQDVELKPASEAFNSSEAALAAVLKGAKEYDDSILEQFTQPGEDCTWCPEFYNSVRDMATNPKTPQDQKSYLAEVLAISGRLENVETLTEAIKNAGSADEADVYASALELAVGKEDITRYLGDQMSATNESLREASVAAVTNQGNRLAVELLLKNTIERGDPDGYYGVGIGIGELIPTEDAMPVLHEMVQKRDEYSHLGVKSLLNGGMEGLRIVFDELENSKDTEADKKLLKDAIDHVNFEDGMEEYLKQKIENSKQSNVVAFAKQIQEEFNQANQEFDQIGESEEEPKMTMAEPAQ
jgi:hypothetical protein